MYRSTEEEWAEERKQVAARYAALKRRREREAEIATLPTMSQRVIGRLLLALGRG